MMVAAQRAPWQNPRILSTLLLVFLAGATTGALSMRMGLHDKLHRSSASGSREAVLQKFRTELDLTGAQTEKLGTVLDDYSQYYQSLQDQLDDLRATGKTRILQILNSDQRAKFERMMADLAPQLAGSSGAK
jgi:Spy/CpxP family protein refolding chaperone